MLDFDVAQFKEKLHREVRPLLKPAMGPSANQDHFKDKMQLRALYFNLLALADSIAQEEVICRYRKKRTSRHVRLVQSAEEAYENLRQLAIMFNLMH